MGGAQGPEPRKGVAPAMDSALEVDLAKPEATAAQVLDSALGQRSGSPNSNQPIQQASISPNEQSQRSAVGGSATTIQPRLNPRAVPDRVSPSPSRSDNTEPVKSLELGDHDDAANTYYLQPVDKGFGAWSYVASAFAMYIVVWGMMRSDSLKLLLLKNSCADYLRFPGFPQSFPIFQSYLSSRETAQLSDSMILPLLAPGLQNIQEGLLFQFLPKSAKHRQAIVAAGIIIITSAMISASFAHTALQIVATQGILFGLGGILLNFVHVSVFSEWFDQKRGQAMGLIWFGFRFGGLTFPLICQWLLDKHGYQKTLRVLIAPMLALLLPSVVLFRGRYPVSIVQLKPIEQPRSKLAALRTPSLPFYLLIAVLFAAVTNVPMMFITKFAADLILGSADRALALSLVFLGNMLGPFLFGRFSDSGFYPSMMGASAVSTSLLHFLFWGFVKEKHGLFGYAICVGITSGGKLPYDCCEHWSRLS
ncbi:MAG: hypothetical protein Q9191_002607 [Dirinaria sp. TL-2023a]